MPTNKEKLIKGMQFIAVGLPFVFAGPVLLTWAGMPYAQRGNYLWLIVSILFMITAAYFCVRGLRTVLSSFFDGDSPG